MDDLISREAAIEAALDGADYWDGGYSPERERCIREYMAKVPAVDAVQVVRCKDCRHWHEDIGATTKWLMCHEIVTNSNWFCANGERRDSE